MDTSSFLCGAALLLATVAGDRVFAAGASDSTAAQRDAVRYTKLALAKAEEGDRQYALTLVQKSLTIDSASVPAWMLYARLLQPTGDPEGVLRAYSRAAALAPDDHRVYNNAAIAMQAYGKHGYAYELYSRALSVARDSVDKGNLYSNRSGVHGSVQDWGSALRDLDSAASYLPRDARSAVYNNRGMIYMRLGRYDECIADLRRTVDSMPDFAYSNLALVHTRMEDFELALAAYDSAARYIDLEETGHGGLHFSNLGELKYRMGDYAGARRSLNRSIRLYPANSYVYRTLALVYFAEDRRDEGCRAVRTALDRGFATGYGDEAQRLWEDRCANREAPRITVSAPPAPR